MPFDLHPEYPPEGISRAELDRRYGGDTRDRLHAMFEQAGLPYSNSIEIVPNSRGALALGELARDRDVYDELHPRLFDAYWVRGRNLGDRAVLHEEGAAVGLSAQEIDAAVADPDYLDRIEHSTGAVTQLGGNGVPAWLIDRRVLVPGAQPHDVFERVLARLGHSPRET